MSTTLLYAGTYNCDIALPCSCCEGSTAVCRIQYCISTISTTLDTVVSNYIGYYTLGAGSLVSVVTPTFRHIMFVSSATTVYVRLYCSGGANTYAIFNGETFIK